MPAAISSDPPPMSITISRPDDQPNQRRTARNVSRASSSPVSTSRSTPVSARTAASTSGPFGASRMRRGGEGQQVLGAPVLGDLQRVPHALDQPVAPGVVDAARRR